MKIVPITLCVQTAISNELGRNRTPPALKASDREFSSNIVQVLHIHYLHSLPHLDHIFVVLLFVTALPPPQWTTQL